MTSITSLCELACQVAQKKLEEKQFEEERAAKAKYWKLPICYDDDDDEERSDSLDDNTILGLPLFSAIIPDEPVLSTEEPDNSLNQIEDFSESNEEFSSTDDDSFSLDNIDYVEAAPSNSELVSSEDSDSLMEEMDLFCTPDYPMLSSIVEKDYDSERDILIPKDLPSNNTISFAEKKSFYFDIPLFSRPPAKPPDGDTGILNIKIMGDILSSIPEFMKILANGFHYLQSSLSPLFNLGITYPYLID
nr:hypothetical protein [Tanacetum cinerariifolium]